MGLVFGGRAYFDDLETGRGFEDAMANARRLQHAVAFAHDERRSLILIDNAHPAAPAIDHLKTDAVIMHVIVHRTAVGDADLRGDDAPAEAAGNEIAILHARAACDPRIVRARDYEFAW